MEFMTAINDFISQYPMLALLSTLIVTANIVMVINLVRGRKRRFLERHGLAPHYNSNHKMQRQPVNQRPRTYNWSHRSI